MSGGNKKKYIMYGAAAVSFIAVLSAGYALGRFKAGKTGTAEGLAYLVQAENADMSAVRHKIRALEESEEGTLPGGYYKVIFEDCVIIGDSVPEALKEYGCLNAFSVTAGAGSDVLEQIKMLKDLNPEVIFISYGTDDIVSGKVDMDGFTARYAEFLDAAAEILPDVRVFVNSVFPVRADIAEKRPALEYLSLYNEELQELCDKRNIAYIDDTDLAGDEFYEEDGIHFKPGFYPYWLERMANVAELRQ